MEAKTQPTDRQGRIVVLKKTYTTPALIEYGKLAQLTAAGSGHSNEEHANPTSNSYKIG